MKKLVGERYDVKEGGEGNLESLDLEIHDKKTGEKYTFDGERFNLKGKIIDELIKAIIQFGDGTDAMRLKTDGSQSVLEFLGDWGEIWLDDSGKLKIYPAAVHIVESLSMQSHVITDILELNLDERSEGDVAGKDGQLGLVNGKLRWQDYNSEIHSSEHVCKPHVTKSSAYTTQEFDHLVGVDVSSNTVTITLGDASTKEGNGMIVNDESGNASSNNITVDTESSQSIDGSSSTTITSDYGSLKLYSDGTDWFTK